MKIALLLPDGVGVRNFVLGPFLECACRRNEVVALHGIPEAKLGLYPSLAGNSIWTEPLHPFQDRPSFYLMRQALGFAQMYWAQTRSMRFRLARPVKGPWRAQAAHRAAKSLGWWSATPSRIQRLDRWHCALVRKSPEVESYRQIFQKHRPSILFCSHQRPSLIIAPVVAARSLGIPTATFIFSWDNLTSKARIAAPFDHYMVWSNHMREELLRFYPEIQPERVHIVGTPQFDPYARKSLHWTREEFFHRIGADPKRPLLCYSGGDAGTCPEDALHVDLVMRLIADGKIKGNPQLLVRPAPVDPGTRYAQVRRRWPQLIYAQPKWIETEAHAWSGVLPLPEDVEMLVNVTAHSDVNINLASTMTLDFAIHDKPVVNVAFDVGHPPPFGLPLWEYYYQYEHYQPVLQFGTARIARSPETLAQHINDYLDNPALDRDGRRRFVELEVGVPVGQSSQCIVESLEKIAQDHLNGSKVLASPASG